MIYENISPPLTTKNNKTLIVGATSSLAQSISRILAGNGHELILAGRNEHELELIAADLHTRYQISCNIIIADLSADNFSAADLIKQAGNFNKLIIASGDMGNGNQDDLLNIKQIAVVNYIVPCQIITAAAEELSRQDGGLIAIISSIAGDRGRAKNYEYGAAKAALGAFASGMRQRYAASNVHILTIKPGFIDTQMSWEIESPLIASRSKVAKDIIAAINEKKDVLYTPWFWRYIMLIIKHLPETLFKKLRF